MICKCVIRFVLNAERERRNLLAIFTFLEGVALLNTFPGKTVAGEAALIQRNEKMGAVVTPSRRNTSLVHLFNADFHFCVSR